VRNALAGIVGAALVGGTVALGFSLLSSSSVGLAASAGGAGVSFSPAPPALIQDTATTVRPLLPSAQISARAMDAGIGYCQALYANGATIGTAALTVTGQQYMNVGNYIYLDAVGNEFISEVVNGTVEIGGGVYATDTLRVRSASQNVFTVHGDGDFWADAGICTVGGGTGMPMLLGGNTPYSSANVGGMFMRSSGDMYVELGGGAEFAIMNDGGAELLDLDPSGSLAVNGVDAGTSNVFAARVCWPGGCQTGPTGAGATLWNQTTATVYMPADAGPILLVAQGLDAGGVIYSGGGIFSGGVISTSSTLITTSGTGVQTVLVQPTTNSATSTEVILGNLTATPSQPAVFLGNIAAITTATVPVAAIGNGSSPGGATTTAFFLPNGGVVIDGGGGGTLSPLSGTDAGTWANVSATPHHEIGIFAFTTTLTGVATFTRPFAVAPICVCSINSGTAIAVTLCTSSTTVVNESATATGAGQVSWYCER
jgi:hypothetical protein